MPSRLIEVLPYTILEAIATRLPVIAIKRPGNYEALRDHGAYFADNDDRDLSNIMLQFYANPDLRQDSAQKNFEHFQENFTPEKLINKYMDFIKEIKDKVQVK
jgi:glycosyltransferase involved in cell wall biosynthesis